MSLLALNSVHAQYPGRRGGPAVKAVSDVSFALEKGEVLGIVGESGCGKSTLARTILRLHDSSAGKITFDQKDITALTRRAMSTIRRDMQVVFQDPYGALNPRHTVGTIVGEPLLVHRIGTARERRDQVKELLSTVGLTASAYDQLPHEFSGGQRQRIAIARALALKPKLLIADEAVSALDVSIQSQILNLISDLREQLDLAILFISHDLSVIRHVSDRVAVMYLGRIVEIGSTSTVLDKPSHPYTQALVSAVPGWSNARSERIVLQGELPDPANPPIGCAFNTRCAHVTPRCQTERPALVSRQVETAFSCHACFLHEQLSA